MTANLPSDIQKELDKKNTPDEQLIKSPETMQDYKPVLDHITNSGKELRKVAIVSYTLAAIALSVSAYAYQYTSCESISCDRDAIFYSEIATYTGFAITIAAGTAGSILHAVGYCLANRDETTTNQKVPDMSKNVPLRTEEIQDAKQK